MKENLFKIRIMINLIVGENGALMWEVRILISINKEYSQVLMERLLFQFHFLKALLVPQDLRQTVLEVVGNAKASRLLIKQP